MPLDRISSATPYAALALVKAATAGAPSLSTERPGVRFTNSFEGSAMINGISSSASQSGMAVALQRVEAAASNTANRQTEGATRLRVEQSEAPNGGVQARTVRTSEANDTDRAAIEDALDARSGQRDFEANAAAFRAREDALGSLFNERA